jgi:hypothetical protein
MICKEIPNGGKESVVNIPHVHEQQYFLLIKTKLPNRKTIYEKSIFWIKFDDGTIMSHIPDIFTVMDEGRINITEITTISREDDLKRKKSGERSKIDNKEIVRLVNANYKYTTLYKENLLKIQKHNPWVDFFGAKKIERKKGK